MKLSQIELVWHIKLCKLTVTFSLITKNTLGVYVDFNRFKHKL